VGGGGGLAGGLGRGQPPGVGPAPRLRDVASAPAGALALAKRAVNEGAEMTLAEGLRLERRLAARLR
ncbi:MAG: hypothetical protein OXE50_07495, partial [Chloroflexi bacterium]|nr:hypothetical protein [Chloroflexota bacterium]